jgi:hypothetical protein
LAKITQTDVLDKMELLKYKIRSMKYDITIFHNMLVVYRTVRSLCGGCIYTATT